MQWIGRTCPPGAAHLVAAVRATSAKGWLYGRTERPGGRLRRAVGIHAPLDTHRTTAATPSTTAGTAHGHRITPPPTTGTGSRGTKLTWPAGPTSTVSRCSRQWASLHIKSAPDGDTSTTGVRADHVRPGRAWGLVRPGLPVGDRRRACGRRAGGDAVGPFSWFPLRSSRRTTNGAPHLAPRRRYGGHLPQTLFSSSALPNAPTRTAS